jgi:hypothetical protein
MQKNIITSIIDFYQDIQPILIKKEAFFYIESPLNSYTKIEDIETATRLFTDDYRGFFLSSEQFNQHRYKGFYDDGFFDFVVEGTGGRCNKTEIEAICLRVISKNPDKKTKAIFNAIANYLKENDEYEKGLEPMSSSFYKNTFYKKSIIKNKTIWFDFQRKTVPVIIAKHE